MTLGNMIFRREIGQKGQVVIPVDVRRLLNVQTGEGVIFEVENGNVLIKPASQPEKFIEEFLNTPKLKKKLNAKQLKEVILSEYEVY